MDVDVEAREWAAKAQAAVTRGAIAEAEIAVIAAGGLSPDLPEVKAAAEAVWQAGGGR